LPSNIGNGTFQWSVQASSGTITSLSSPTSNFTICFYVVPVAVALSSPANGLAIYNKYVVLCFSSSPKRDRSTVGFAWTFPSGFTYGTTCQAPQNSALLVTITNLANNNATVFTIPASSGSSPPVTSLVRRWNRTVLV